MNENRFYMMAYFKAKDSSFETPELFEGAVSLLTMRAKETHGEEWLSHLEIMMLKESILIEKWKRKARIKARKKAQPTA